MTVLQLWLLAIGLVIAGAILLRLGRGKVVAKGPNATHHREHHLTLVVIGGTCVGLGAVYMGIEGWDSFKNSPPTWWVKHQMHSDDIEDRQRAIRQMIGRIYKGELPDHTLAEVLDHAIKEQSDTTGTWDPTWGELVACARETGALSQDIWSRYVRNAIDCTPTLHARPKVRRGAPLPVMIHGMPMRADRPMFSPGVRLSYRVQEVYIDGNRIDRPADSTIDISSFPRWQNPLQAFVIRIPPAMEKTLALGEHSLRIVFDRTAQEEVRGPQWGQNLAENRFDLTATWELTDSATVSLVEDDRLIDQVNASLSVQSFPRFSMMDGNITLRVMANGLPVSVACDALLRQGEHQRSLNSFALSHPHARSPRLVMPYPADSRSMQLVLRPSIEAAERTVEVSRIWGAEVVLNVDP